ncbi:MAG: KdsC family phosphatase [Gammaproteobacteria bacterium]
MSMDLAELERLSRQVRVAVFDVDGVLTDGSILLGPDGEEYKQFNVRDGQGMTMLREAGIELAVITGRQSSVVAHRMTELGVRFVYQGRRDKLEALDQLCEEAGVAADRLSYLGDDLPDIPVMRRVGLPIAVADAHPAVFGVACCRTSAPGGRGAAREVAEFLVHACGRLPFPCTPLVPLNCPAPR